MPPTPSQAAGQRLHRAHGKRREEQKELLSALL